MMFRGVCFTEENQKLVIRISNRSCLGQWNMIHLEEGAGDVLVFLTGQEEIESVERLVLEKLQQLPEEKRKLKVLPIYSSLPSEKQMQVFMPAPTGFRKVILATNIAETSVTIPGIKYVIDPGLVKARTYSARTGMESLVVVPTSKAQALQRSGRAGREGPGKCFRLYPEREFEKLSDSTVPEIKRCNLSKVVLQLKALGVDDIIGFDFMEKPSREAVIKSLKLLALLGTLTEESRLSKPVGHQMARLPLDPTHAKALILASQFNCLEEMLIAVAMLSVESIFYAPREKLEEVAVDNLFQMHFACFLAAVRQIRENVEQMGLHVASCGDDMLQFRRCLAAAFFLNAALKQPDGTYRVLSSGQSVQIHPSSVLFRTKPDCLIFDELVRTNHNYIRNVSRVDYLWLPELAPQYYTLKE
ncbi:hypothetical protein RHSIM_Rhsim02G0238100 [Rhododendron simsii]|uniref:RNA helicase n=1 Tax=Rhododendron simsii TaxID=118357 RepID=A0A834HGA0_RHOSS|nr:hypothetical protein RHSIM_Rhsim02G0238100 [Rhododendron simsii]